MSAFPYIQKIRINDCFTYQNLEIDTGVQGKGFKHIIITGKNGSGKTTILNRIDYVLEEARQGIDQNENIKTIKDTINYGFLEQSEYEESKKKLKAWQDVVLFFTTNDHTKLLQSNRSDFIFSFFKAHRKVQLRNVETVTKESDFLDLKTKKNQENFTALFKQYLVNKKVYEAFDLMDERKDRISESKLFFDNLTKILQTIFHDPALELEFVRENFEFFLKLGDGRKITFNQLSEGFSAFLSILMDLFMRTDLIRRQKRDLSYDPCGFVLIDEPETHLHLSMQYEILPIISRLFPNLQLIVATHSPAVISSLKNSVVYDLSSQQQVADWLLGSSYSELMVKHFGLDNEFSPIADKILLDVQHAVLAKDSKKLQDILIENEKYLTPSLRLEIESQIIELQSKNASYD